MYDVVVNYVRSKDAQKQLARTSLIGQCNQVLASLKETWFAMPRSIIKMDSTQGSRNKCKKYLLKSYSSYGNIFNAIWNISV